MNTVIHIKRHIFDNACTLSKLPVVLSGIFYSTLFPKSESESISLKKIWGKCALKHLTFSIFFALIQEDP